MSLVEDGGVPEWVPFSKAAKDDFKTLIYGQRSFRCYRNRVSSQLHHLFLPTH